MFVIALPDTVATKPKAQRILRTTRFTTQGSDLHLLAYLDDPVRYVHERVQKHIELTLPKSNLFSQMAYSILDLPPEVGPARTGVPRAIANGMLLEALDIGSVTPLDTAPESYQVSEAAHRTLHTREVPVLEYLQALILRYPIPTTPIVLSPDAYSWKDRNQSIRVQLPLDVRQKLDVIGNFLIGVTAGRGSLALDYILRNPQPQTAAAAIAAAAIAAAQGDDLEA